MKAILYTKYGSPDNLQLQEIDKPVPGENEVLVKVHAASINSWDWDLVRGKPFIVRLAGGGITNPKIPILGCDIAGKVEEVGKDVKQFQPGDVVFGDLSEDGWGGFAEYVCANEKWLARKRESMSFEQAAAIPQAALLALQGLRDVGKMKPGDKLLINGAGGGVGTFGLQLAKTMGLDVTCVDKAEKLDLLLSMGANTVINFQQEDFTRNRMQYDLILDNVARRSMFAYLRALAPGGRFVMTGGKMRLMLNMLTWGRLISGKKKLRVIPLKPNPKDLDHMGDLFESGAVVPVIDRTFPLEETPDAFRYFGEGHFKGKVVISVE